MEESSAGVSAPPASPLARRDFLKTGLAGAGAALLLRPHLDALVRASERPRTTPHSKTPLLVWYWGQQEAPGMQSFMEKAVARYNAQQSRVSVTAILQSSDTLYSAFAAAAEAGKGPDVQYLWGGTQALIDVWLGYCAPLSDYVDAAWLKNIPTASLSETNWGGKQWGLPFYQIPTALPYNKKLFSKAGLNPEEPPTTWEDFITALKKLNHIGVTPIGAGFKDQYLGGWLVSYFGQQNFNSVAQAIAPFKSASVKYSGGSLHRMDHSPAGPYQRRVFQQRRLVDQSVPGTEPVSHQEGCDSHISTAPDHELLPHNGGCEHGRCDAGASIRYGQVCQLLLGHPRRFCFLRSSHNTKKRARPFLSFSTRRK